MNIRLNNRESQVASYELLKQMWVADQKNDYPAFDMAYNELTQRLDDAHEQLKTDLSPPKEKKPSNG
jgi:hypothetical protein